MARALGAADEHVPLRRHPHLAGFRRDGVAAHRIGVHAEEGQPDPIVDLRLVPDIGQRQDVWPRHPPRDPHIELIGPAFGIRVHGLIESKRGGFPAEGLGHPGIGAQELMKAAKIVQVLRHTRDRTSQVPS